MSSCPVDPTLPAPRISGRIGQTIGLNTTFYHNGVATDPFAIRRIDIYKTSVKEDHLVARVLFPDPRSKFYPLPALNVPGRPGFFQLNYPVPATFTEGIYFDVWRFIGVNPGPTALGSNASEALEGTDATVVDLNASEVEVVNGEINEGEDEEGEGEEGNGEGEDEDEEADGGEPVIGILGPDGKIQMVEHDHDVISDPDDPALNIESTWLSQCNKFWLFPDGWFLDDGLIIPRFAFEPLDSRFRKGEIRTLETGIMPLPLYDYDVNRIMPLIPRLCATISISTENCELLVDRMPCTIGLRQGSYRVNPYVVQCTLDTSTLLIGTYVYQIKLSLPNGETRISEPFRFYVV